MSVYLLVASGVMLACVFLSKISNKLGIPTLLAFIVLGMVFGSDGILKIPFDDYGFAEMICSAALIVIMFYGGFGTNWKAAKPVAAKSVLLSTLGVILTAAFTGTFCFFVLKIDILESMLIGSVVSSTDAASVFSVLRSKRLDLKYGTASMLEMESGSNDPAAYMLSAVVIKLMREGVDGAGIALIVAQQVLIGLLFGAAIAISAARVMTKLKAITPGYDTVFVLAAAVLAYAAPQALGGNGYLSAYIVGLYLGNAGIKNQKALVPFFDGLTGLMQMLIFFLLGLLCFPSKLPPVMLPSLFIYIFLTLVARPAAVFLLLSPFRCRLNQMLTVSFSGLRGAASIVFAVMAVMAVKTENDIFHIVFCIVLYSILFQGSLIPYVSKKLKMIDRNDDVMKTFSDYVEEAPVQFIRFSVPADHPWCDTAVKNTVLPPETIIVLLIRNSERIVPKGETVILRGDTLVLSAKAADDIPGVKLTERVIGKNDKYAGKTIADSYTKKSLIVMIKRGGRVIIPQGSTVIKTGDVLVLNDAVQ